MRQALNAGRSTFRSGYGSQSDRSARAPVKTLLALALAAAVAAVLAPAAEATFPGKNGRIAFERFTRFENTKIFSTTSTGRKARRITRSGGGFKPDFSPSGARIAFERDFGRPRRGGVFVVRSSGGRGTRVSRGCSGQCLGDGSPAWSPDGRQILFGRALGPVVRDTAAEVDLMIMNRDGGGQRLVRRFGRAVDGREPGKAHFSPDGRQIAVTLQTLSADPRRSGGSAVYVMNADGTNLRAITPAALHGGNVDWSPNGDLIVFNSNNDVPFTRSELWVVGPDGSGLRRLRRLRRGRDYQPVWSPDGRQIAFGHDAPQGVFQHIWTMRSNGSRAHRITKPGQPAEEYPEWGARR